MSDSRTPVDNLSQAIGRPRTVLDVGSEDGRSGAAKERGARVVGIASAGPASTEARARFDEVIEADIEAEGAAGALGERRFDLLLLGSAAENAKDASAVFRRFISYLEDGGHVIVSFANREAAERLAQGAGLDVLHVVSAGSGRAAVVARKLPSRKRLSLTVGMISMNEAGAVAGVIDGIRAHAKDAEILLVDSSKDETPQIAERKGARVVRQFPPRGYGPAMHRLLYEATGDVIITMDCDGSYPADRIPALHEMIEAGEDLVNATRVRHRPKAMPFANFVANRVFAAAARVMHGIPTTDLHSGMRAYRTSMLRGFQVDPNGAALPVDLLVVPARLGYRIVEVEIPYLERVGASSLHRFDSTMWTFRRLARARLGRRLRGNRSERISVR